MLRRNWWRCAKERHPRSGSSPMRLWLLLNGAGDNGFPDRLCAGESPPGRTSTPISTPSCQLCSTFQTTESKFAVTVPSQKVPAQIDKHSLCSDFATTSACIAFITITPSYNPCMTPFEYASSISLKRSYKEGILFYVLLPNFLALFNNWHCSHKPSIANVRYNIAMLQLHCSCKPFFSV